jgi:hypothetical protein
MSRNIKCNAVSASQEHEGQQRWAKARTSIQFINGIGRPSSITEGPWAKCSPLDASIDAAYAHGLSGVMARISSIVVIGDLPSVYAGY